MSDEPYSRPLPGNAFAYGYGGRRRPGPDRFMSGLFALERDLRAEEAGERPRGSENIAVFLETARDDADTVPVPSNLLFPPVKP